MASRKDYASKKRAPKKPVNSRPKVASAPKPSPEPASAPRAAQRQKPWKLIVASILAITCIVTLLQTLSNVDPKEIRETGINSLLEGKLANTAPIAPPTVASPPTVSTPKPAPTVTTTSQANTLAKPLAKTPKKQPPIKDITQQAEEKESYQFYKILAQNSVETENIAAYKFTPKTAKLEKKTLLQTGSFRQQKDAERMKARLLLNNFPAVKISKSISDKGTWFRVRTGPFATFDKLKSALTKLNKLNITPLQIPVS